MPGVFERKREDLAEARARLAGLTSADEYRELRRTTLNAHYTHARYVQVIWDALGQLGFSSGRVLEPGCGSGNFIGLAPGGAEMTGIERDPVTAAITAALYPHADIRAESFADTRIRAGYFDAAVGNVPFGKFKLADPGHNPGRRLSIHNHFIVKALALTRPGGMVALLTSRYTMDSRNPEARRKIADLADLVAAIRLPTSAHRQAAGTDVVTDLLILRRREPGPPAEPAGWELAPELDLPGGQARVNAYFTAHPEFVLGEMRVGRGAHNENELIVAGSPDAAPGLAAALETAVVPARAGGLVMTERAEAAEPSVLASLAPQGGEIEGLIQALPDGTFTRLAVTGSDMTALTAQPYRPPATQARELRQLLGLRDTVLALLRAEAVTADDSEEITRLRAQLNAGYGAYVARYGPVKRFTWSAGRADPATSEKKQIRRRPPQGGFRNDPLYPLAYALEESYDPATRTAARADIFTQRVVVPEPPLLGADTADEALAICLNTHGEVRLEEVTRLLGADSDAEARAELGTLVYDEPGTSRLTWAPLYLSGDVRAKLAAATAAAASDPRFAVNVPALREVIPRDLGPAEIEAQLGAGWIAPEYVQQFLRETLGDNAVTVERTRGRKWKVSGGNRKSVTATSTWGTRAVCAHDLAQRLLTGTAEQVQVKYEIDGKKVVDHEATEAARQKARDLADRFSIWIWEETGRARDLSRVYNDRYNAVVPVNFDNVQLLTPGLSAALDLRKHQPPAIARIIYQGSAGLVHDTGAGKTLEAIIGVRERQRLGLSHKPCFVVQKHKLTDFRDEFLRAYPSARLLVADTEDLTGNKRREFIARCATGNPTAIIMSREAFRSIPVSAERIAAFLKEEELAFEQAIEDAQASGEDDRTIKQIEADLLNAQERRKEQVAKIGQDRGLCYEDTGIDYVVVDEARGYRKGPIVSSLPGMADPGSARALDLLLKLGYHKELYGETRVCLADATPFTNRISEIYTWMRYLNLGVEDFDSWVRTFGKMATAYEMTPGGGYKAKARLREIINAVDLNLWLRELNDFKLKDSLDLKLPVMTGGKPEIVQVPAPDELMAYASEIAWRYEHLPKGPPEKGADNHLKVQGDAIKSALDLRLVGRSTSQPQKADVTADVLFRKWLKHRDDVYQREDGSEHPVRGSLILVFASLGTPGRTRKPAEGQESGRFDQWDFYTELRGQLIARGMPGRLIRFIHEAGNAQQKEELFRASRNGEIAVLIGSTEKLGTGTNVQDRAVGLVQVTAPWNWDEPHQELGRVERQGNQNSEFFCTRVVTTPSADAIKWERARQKEHSFRALMSGRIEGRTIRIPDDDLTAAEMMAAASGEPRLLERAELEGTISRLHTLRRAWAQNQTGLGYAISDAEQRIARKKQAIAKIDAALTRRKDTRGDAFAMTVNGRRLIKRTDAAERLRELLRQRIAAVPRSQTQQHVALGEIGGFALTATLAPDFANSISLTLEGIPDLPAPLVLNHRDLPEQTGIITRLENRLSGLEQVRAETEAAIGHLTSESEAARASIGGSFPQQDEYEQACARLDTLETELVGESKRAGNAADPETADTPGLDSARHPVRNAPDRQPASPNYGGAGRRASAAASPEPADTGTRSTAAGSPAAASAHSTAGAPPRPGTDHGTGTGEVQPDERASAPAVADWTAAHPLASHIDKLLLDACVDSQIVASASANDPQNFRIAFSDWLDRRVAEIAVDGNAPGAMELVKAYFDDPAFGADLTATLAASICTAHDPGTPPGDLTALAPGVIDTAARHWRELAEETRREKHGCDPANGTCAACAADPRSEERLRLATEIDVHMTRLGVPREGRTVAWDSPAGTYIIQCTAGQQPAWQLTMPADGAIYAVFRSGQWSDAQLHLRRGQATPAQVAVSYAAMLAGQASTQIRLAPAMAGTVVQQDAVPGRDETAAEPAAAGSADPAARQDPQDRPSAAVHGSHRGAADPAPAAAAEPVPHHPGSLVIEHHQQGTLVHGTEKDDLRLRRLLHQHGFRWSGNLDAWYLPRPWTFNTRDRRVTGLTASLQQAGRSFTRRDQPPAPAADDSVPEPVPAGEPYAELRQAQEDHQSAIQDYWQLTRTPAGNRVMATRPPGGRPDAVALSEAYRRTQVSWHQAFAGEPQEVAERFVAWMQAASALSRNLAAERHRAPKFRQTLGEFIASATRLASRTQATAQDPGAWARVFAAIPGNNPPEAGAPAAAASPDQPASGGPPQTDTASVAAAGSQTGPPPDAPVADPLPSRLPPGTRVRARPGRSKHEEVITLISGPESFFPDLPATYVGETADGQRCAVDPAGITEILGSGRPHSEMPPTAEAGREVAQDKAALSGAPQDRGSGSTDDPAAARGTSALADPADSPASANWQAQAARLAAAERCTFHLYRATDGTDITHCVITAAPPRMSAGYLSVTPAGRWTETWRGQVHPLGPGALSGPDYPITLSEARALAAVARLEVHITRAADRAFVSLAEPGAASAPALSFEYGSREVFAGRQITTASRAIAWLATYRASADELAAGHGGDIFTAAESSPGWKCRIAHLIPHLPDGPDHDRAVAEHLTDAIRLARRSQPTEAEQALRRAEAASPALVIAPAREAALTERIESDAARYAWTGTPGRYIAETMQATPPEWRWIDSRIAAGTYTEAPASARQPRPAPATAQDSTAAARDLAGQARSAYDQGHHGPALAFIDDAEVCDPIQQHRYDQIRQVITTAAAAPPEISIPGESASSPAGAQPVPAESQAQPTAAQSPPGRPVPDLSELPPEPTVPPRESVDSWSLKSMKGYMAAQDSLMAWRLAEEAGRLQRVGSSHQDVMTALAGAESVAPEADRPIHAARLDAYAAAYGLRGWYRGTGRDRDGRDGQPVVHVNRIRTEADGDRGRYFYHGRSAVSGRDYAVIDRDTGHQAARCATREEADAWIEHAEKRTGPVSGADAARSIPLSGADDEAAATKGKETGPMVASAAPAAPAAPSMVVSAGPPDGTQPVAAHTEWGGPLRPGRLLYADGTPLTVRGQGEDRGQGRQATAAGAAPVAAGSDHATVRLQVVRWETGGYGIVHPALACRRGTDPYMGLSDRDRARWAAFDLAEARPADLAGLPPHLVDPGDVLQVERGPRSRIMDQYEVQSIQATTGGLEFTVKGCRSPLHYPDRSTIAVAIPVQHPALTAVTPDTRTAGPAPAETAATTGDTPAPQSAAGGGPGTAVAGMAPDQDPPGAADGTSPDGLGRYSGRIQISDSPGRPTVSGTSYQDDPPELREALRTHGFTWRKQREVWEHIGPAADRHKDVAVIRELLARLDRDAVPSGGEMFPPTPQQQAILDACAQGKDVAVQALAGTGKTTTLVLVARALMDRSPDTRIVYTAFNADIVADARHGRFGRNVTALTMHSIAKQALLGTSYAAKVTDGGQGARWPEQWADVLGIRELTAAGADPVPAEAVARLVIATVKKFRESGDDQPGRHHLPGHLSGAAQNPLAKAVLSYARKAWSDITDTGNTALLAAGQALRVDHDDYLKVWALCRPRIGADVIFFDEAQDVNAVMRQVILDQPAQTIVVGDSHQSIYGFRGAIDALKDWPADVVLPLTQSWRFGPDAAEFGNLFLRSLGSGLLLEGNPALSTRLGRADDPDAILCRTNATAVAEVFAGLESGKRTALAGGGQAINDIAKAARDLQAGRGTKHPDLSRFADWDAARAYAQQEEDGKSLQALVRLVDRHGPDGLLDMISRLTPETDTKNPPQLTVSTTHKAKGREWPIVRIADDFRGPVTDPATATTTWPSPEERRLAYVTATRARKLLETGSLTWIYDYPQTDRREGQGTQPTPPLQDTAASPAPRAAATAQPSPVLDTSTNAAVGQPAPDPGNKPPGHAAAGDSPQKPDPDMRDDALAPSDAKADGTVAAARRRAEARDQAHAPIDDARANAMIRRQRAALTRAVNSGDPAKVILAAQKAVSEWTQPGMAWPDDWSRWQRALDDAMPRDQRILLEDLPVSQPTDVGAPRSGDKAERHADAADETAAVPPRGEPAVSDDPEPTATPANNGDLAIALHRLPDWEFARFVSGAGTPGPAGSGTTRRDGEPDAGAHEDVNWGTSAIDITIRARGTLRHSRVSWAQVASWIDPGMTPARLGLIVETNLLSSFCRSRREELIAAGNTDPDAAGRELSEIRRDTIGTVISTALRARGAAAPIPSARSAQPVYQTAAMIIRPGPAASKDENAALERLARLRTAIRQLQPASDADIKTTIRRWLGDGLPGYVGALDRPAAMREWISGQVTARAARPGRGTYDTPGISGGVWSGASPEGLVTARDGEHRTEALTPWMEVPAWIQPGISQWRERLLAAADSHRAIIRSQLHAAAHIQAVPGEQQDKEKEQAARILRETIDAAWAAIDAAPAPTPGQREQACRTYEKDASPVQEPLFADEASPVGPGQEAGKPADDPAEPSQPPPVPADTGPARRPADRPAAPQAGDPQRQGTLAGGEPDLPRGVQRPRARAAGDPAAGSAPSGIPAPTSAGGVATSQLNTKTAAEEEEIMSPVLAAGPVPATEPIAAADSSPAQPEPAAAREATAETRTAGAPAHRDDEEARLIQDLDEALQAIVERRRATAQSTARASAEFADIRAAFASLRGALELPADGSQADLGNPAPDPVSAQPLLAATAGHARPAPEADDFGDIRSAFAALRQALDLPAQGRDTRAPGPKPLEADAASDRLLDQATAEAQACARWYRDTPEWQRMTTVSRAARDLITAIRQASGDYWTEIRQDVRVRGCIRTVAARVSLAISGTAHILAGRLEGAGHRDTRIWRAAWGLHRATATFADRVMRYAPPPSPDRMGDVRRIVNDLGQRPRHPGEPGSSRPVGSRSREAGTTSAAALGMEGFPLPVSSATIRQAAASGARTAAPPLRQAHAGRRS